MVFLRLSVRLIGLISTLILVRLLTPSDFGIVAMAMSIVAAIEMMKAFGFDVVLIQDQKAGPDEYNTAWTLNVALGVGSAILLVVLSFPAAMFYEEPRLEHVFYVIALASLLQGFENIGLVDFRKHLDFDKEFIYQLLIKLFSFCVTVTLAYMLRTYWALVIGTVSSRAAAVFLSYIMHPYRPRLTLASLRKIFGFSKWLFMNNLLYFLRFRSPDFIVGKISGSSGLGLFTISYEISNLPTTELIAPINRALLPGFSKISDDQENSRRAFVKAASVLALISLPAGFGIASIAELLVPVLLGEKWNATIPLIKVLAIFGSLVAVQSPIGTVLLALGNPRLVSTLAAANAVILIPTTILLSIRDGLAGTAFALLLVSLTFLPVYYGVAARQLGLSIRDISKIFARPTIATLIMYFIVSTYVGTIPPSLINMLLAALAGAVIFSLSMGFLWYASSRPEDSAEAYVISVVSPLIRKFSRRKTRL